MDLKETYKRVEEARKFIVEAQSMASTFSERAITGGDDEVLKEAGVITDKLEEAQQILLETEAEGLPEPADPSEPAEGGEAAEEREDDALGEETFDFMLEKQQLEHQSRLIEARVYRAAADKVGEPIVAPGTFTETQDEMLNCAAVALEAALGSHPDPQTLIELAELRILQLEIKKARYVCDLAIQFDGEGLFGEKAKALLERMDLDPALKDRGKCFIATAACGSPAHPDVGTLRRFRDESLVRSALGRALVRSYYLLSPPIAIAIERHPAVQRLVRSLIVAPAAATVRKVYAA